MQMVEEEVNNIDMMGLSAREMEIIDLVASYQIVVKCLSFTSIRIFLISF